MTSLFVTRPKSQICEDDGLELLGTITIGTVLLVSISISVTTLFFPRTDGDDLGDKEYLILDYKI